MKKQSCVNMFPNIKEEKNCEQIQSLTLQCFFAHAVISAKSQPCLKVFISKKEVQIGSNHEKRGTQFSWHCPFHWMWGLREEVKGVRGGGGRGYWKVFFCTAVRNLQKSQFFIFFTAGSWNVWESRPAVQKSSAYNFYTALCTTYFMYWKMAR